MSQNYISKADLQSLSVDQFLEIDLDHVQLLAPKKVLPAGKYAFVTGAIEVIEMGKDKNSGLQLPFNLTGAVELADSKAILPEDVEWPLTVAVNCQLENDKDGNGKRRFRTLTEGYAAPRGLKTGTERMAVFEGMTGVLDLQVDTYKRDDGTEVSYNTINPFTVVYN